VSDIEIGRSKRARRAYAFDDIAIVPSRRTRDPHDVSVSWTIDAFTFDIPVLAAPMDSVDSPTTAIAMGRLGGEFGGGARVVYADVYDVPYDIIANPSGYGFEEVAQGCCGTGAIETSVLCGMDAAFTCQNADKYVFFDSVHPSQRTYKILADDLIRNSLQVFM
jgi:hypothetical protein